MAIHGKRVDEISRAFADAGLRLLPKELERFGKLNDLLLKRKDELDLTRIDDPASIIAKHYVDGAMAAEIMRPKGVLMDLGSGAGFPGLPMAIRKPGWRLLLAEPRRRKLQFIEEAIEALDLGNVEIFPHKVTASFGRSVWGVVTRDCLSVAEAVELCAGIIPAGGVLYLMKGSNAHREMEEAESTDRRGDFGPAMAVPYRATNGRERFLVTLKKTRGAAPTAPSLHNITEIASTGNSRFRGWLALSDSRGIRKRGECFVYGRKAVRDLVAACPAAVLGAVARRADELEGLGIPPDAPVYLVRREIFPDLDIFGTGPPLLIAKAPPLAAWDPEAPLVRDTFFAPFQDPANVGALVRTAAAMGADAVLLKEAASPYHPKALRASGPALWQTAVLSGPSLEELAALKRSDVYALTPEGSDVFSFKPPVGPVGLAMGLEGPGLAGSWSPKLRLGIPMAAGVESLNAAVAAAVALAVTARNRMG
ncbi:MAG: class I SAM-dependent methyltransferase [Deltaproteobacteria bacterium]|jgi:16S rRNA (guanine527-N7)-methyltransferase|nr:class I SAM-dependent methyltransferase [Deltaproteobacteria bacterium]